MEGGRWRERDGGREEEKKRLIDFLHWYTPQMPAMAWADPGQSQNPSTPLRSPTWVLEAPFTVFPGTLS